MTTDSVSAHDDILTTEQIREGFADVSPYITDWERKELRGQFDEWLSSLLASARADGWDEGWHAHDVFVGKLEDASAAGQGVNIPRTTNPHRASPLQTEGKNR